MYTPFDELEQKIKYYVSLCTVEIFRKQNIQCTNENTNNILYTLYTLKYEILKC